IIPQGIHLFRRLSSGSKKVDKHATAMMKYTILTLAFAALSSAKLFCTSNVSQLGSRCGDKRLFCCLDTSDPFGPWQRTSRECSEPEEGQKVGCGLSDEKVACID
ncbi:hypothetical protein BUE80_DR008033, partial [Diplocarpon rosae]